MATNGTTTNNKMNNDARSFQHHFKSAWQSGTYTDKGIDGTMQQQVKKSL